MEVELPQVLNVLAFARSPDILERIRAVAPDRLNIVDARDDFLDEMRQEHPPRMLERLASQARAPQFSPEERERIVRETHIVFVGTLPYPLALPRRMQSLIWAHYAFAGTTNLKGTGWWGGPFVLTSSRGHNQALPIAESVIAGMFMFARRLEAATQRTAVKDYSTANFPTMKLVAGKTMGIVGLGGIGGNVARLAKACGMRVIAARRSAQTRRSDVDGVDELFPPSDLHAMLGQADFVAVCAMWTDETERMMNQAAFAAMRPGAYLLNIARGEIIEEQALVDALTSGRLAGAYLDVWDDDMAKPPSALLQSAPNIVFSPHVSNRSDVPQTAGVELCCDNLRRLLKGEPLVNVVDWARGY